MPNRKVPADVRKSLEKLAQPRPMRRGSVSKRFMKCGRKDCRCQHDPKERHGPYYSITRAEGGKTKSRHLSAEQAVVARQQAEDGKKFREQLERYWRACEQWADAELQTYEAAPDKGAAKKGASKKRSRGKLPRKSNRS